MANRWKLLFNGAVSGWRLLNFTSLSFDIYENKAARSGSYIKTPEKYSNPKCELSPSSTLNKYIQSFNIYLLSPNLQGIISSLFHYFVCNFDSNLNKLETFKGDNCVQDLLVSLYHLAEECIREMRLNQLMEMSDEDTRDFYNAERCHICKKIFLIKVIIKLETMIIEQVNI